MASSPSTQKVTMFGAKSGFVIPRNKLSGSMVPTFRGGKKQAASEPVNEEGTKQVQRKTKWGPDLTQDASVRRGRALAYQTRVEQITQQLKLGLLGIRDSQEEPSGAVQGQESSGNQIDKEKLNMLDLEKRELIGEILKLNPNFKAPPDYKPVLKEARVPIPVKDDPGHDFIGLLCGAEGGTIKRLEKETGAEVKIFCTKAVTGEKHEISPSDVHGNHIAYKELYVHLSADTFEKLDAAVALIELLVTSISGTPAAISAESTSASTGAVDVPQGQVSTISCAFPVVLNQGVVQTAGLAGNSVQGHGQPHLVPWFSGGPQHAASHPSSGFTPVPTSAPILNNPTPVPSQSLVHPVMPSSFGAPPTSFSVLSNQSFVHSVPQQPVQGLQQPYWPLAGPSNHNLPPRTSSISGPQPPQVQHNAPNFLTSAQSTPTGLPPTSRPLMPLLPPFVPRFPQDMSSHRPVTPGGSSSGWSGSFAASSVAPTSNAVMQRPLPPSSYPFQSIGPQPSSSYMNQPLSAPLSSASLFPMTVPVPTSAPAQSQASLSGGALSPNGPPFFGPARVPLPVASTPSSPVQPGIAASVSGTLPSFTPIKSLSVTAPPQHPCSGDFTFRPLNSQNPVPQGGLRAASQPATQFASPGLIGTPPLVSQGLSFRPAMPTPGSQPMLLAFPRQNLSNNVAQPHAQFSTVPFPGSPNAVHMRPRLQSFPVGPTPDPHLAVRNSGPASQTSNMAGPFLQRPGIPGHFQQNYPPMIRPDYGTAQNQQLNNLPFASGRPASNPSGGQHIYDPFAPTSVSHADQQEGDLLKTRKQENDPEYEDLMASVGVR